MDKRQPILEQLALFDYGQLDSETRIVVQQRTGEIKALMKRTAQDIIEIGEKLIEVKERLPHGAFGGWLEAEFEWSEPTAQRFMRVADRFKSVNLTDLTIAPSALYLLAAPSTPDEARQEAISRSEAGERITHKVAKNILNGRVASPNKNGISGRVKGDFEGVVNSNTPINQVPVVFDNRQSHQPEPRGRDYCQSPPYAILPILPYLPKDKIIWEPANGEGYLKQSMVDNGLDVVSSCLLTGQDFFDYEPEAWDIIVTNPPWSRAQEWIERCFLLGKPFALLLKTEILGNKGIQALAQKFSGFELVFPESRINYKMPVRGWEADGAPFNSNWYTFGLGIGRALTFLAPINEEKKSFEAQLQKQNNLQGEKPTK